MTFHGFYKLVIFEFQTKVKDYTMEKISLKFYEKLNTLTGWFVFLVAVIVFFLTLEPTASWWDCSERITASYKLEIPHPPGAPFFMLLGRFFTLFAPSGSSAALFMNGMSALAASFTVMLLFWIITHFARKIVIGENNEISSGKVLSILGSGLVGALALCFSTSFWFVAVEAEAYATSAFFTAFVFWCILKWEYVANHKHSHRWLILIAYLMGLSIGVHLLNLLAIPAIVFVYYLRKYPATRKGIIYSSLVSVLLLGSFIWIIIPGVIEIASKFELLFVNSFGLPFNSGVLFFVAALTALIVWALYYTHKKKKPILNTIILGLTMVLIGYSSYALTIIRSSADPPMDQNSPDNVFSLISYLNREQYGQRPLFRGEFYSAPQIDVEEGRPIYIREDGRYEIANYKSEPVYHPDFIGFFPRMYSNSPSHIREYENWGNIRGRRIRVTVDGETEVLTRPTFVENIRFFLRYQVWHMYGRYFMWNFVGRQNDMQGHGEILKGNWLSGIRIIDEMRLGPQTNLPDSIANHPSRNIYFGLPLLLGLFGFFFHLNRNPKDFTAVLLLFVFTGLAIVVYLNQTPIQPRERDYSYVGSFFAFSIWIGLGTLSLIEWMRKKVPLKIAAISTTLITLFAVPLLMASQNWNDHDRSGRFTARDFAFNYLSTCEPDAIIFTHGDNDTFPLWYAQEVEGHRTDVRVANLMLLNTHWYIDQMKLKMNESPPLPLTLPRKKYVEGTNNLLFILDRFDDYVDLRQVVNFIADESSRSKVRLRDGREVDYVPTNKFRIPVDRDKVIENGTVSPELADEVVPAIEWSVDKNFLQKNHMILLDLLAHNNWERPIYFVTGGTEDALGLEEYFQLEGFAYRLVPVRTEGNDFEYGRVNSEVMYDNFINKFDWGRMNEPDVHLCHYNIRTIRVLRLRQKFSRLANTLLEENRRDSALVVLDRAMELMPSSRVPNDFMMLGLAESYYMAEEPARANEIITDYYKELKDELNYYFRFGGRHRNLVDQEKTTALQLMNELARMAGNFDQEELSEEIKETFEMFLTRLSSL